MRRAIALSLLASLVVALTAAPAAQATFHLIKVREVYPGSADDSYVELQMYAEGENHLTGHSMTVYNSSGALVHTSTFPAPVTNGKNQATVLIGDSGVEAKFGVAPDLVDSELAIPAAGGAACWNAGGAPADCVAWGNFSGGTALQAATGTTVGSPASPAGITSGKAIRRTIEPNCPTLLEAGDDSNDSAIDFSEVTPAPRDNASPITEKTCDTTPPTTIIDSHPANPSPGASATFTFHANEAGSTFECSLSLGASPPAFSPCISGQTYTGLADGEYTFEVRATDPAENQQPVPTKFTWTVDNSVTDTTPPETKLDSFPPDPSLSATVSFTFESNEPGSSFQCSLDGAVFAPCAASGVTYSGLANGPHAFQVRAVDPSANVDPTPAGYSFSVLAATPLPIGPPQAGGPPKLLLTKKAPTKTSDRTPTFRFRSEPAGATFQCSLDGGPFRACRSPFTPKPLAFGSHTLQVRTVGLVPAPKPLRVHFKIVRKG
ncbi:MAG: hypothetical protein ACTHLH_03320 [Solirubrobacterales bacterium]